jgi:hypothetical protein
MPPAGYIPRPWELDPKIEIYEPSSSECKTAQAAVVAAVANASTSTLGVGVRVNAQLLGTFNGLRTVLVGNRKVRV